ncbi:hypothetical protein BJ994_001590 [Arthrobacter pigmenti]|uniref:Uncharacterized protein n=1 Tax=Arthrobacter pigmenti TaxID=271432 RepID=A0A846RQ45_9MICC|nr:hypothetical protein [Arthrobacter pigmenti]NJC22514.1 hypothetical protein [Arthrobacter pigmenti]
MALGRHRAEPREHPTGHAVPSDFPLWGAFACVIAAGSMAVFDVPVTANAMTTVVLGLGFLLVWWLASTSTRRSAGPGGTPSKNPEPSSTLAISTPAQMVPRPPADLGRHDAYTHDDERTAGAGSRWIDTFGPPETGQLPIQRYVEGKVQGAFAPPANEGTTQPQWSHSRS